MNRPLSRIDEEFKREIEKIQEKNKKSSGEITRDIIRCPEWIDIKEKVMKGKRGQSFFDIFIVMTIGLIMVVGFAILMFTTHTVNNALHDVGKGSENPFFNFTEITETTIGGLDSGMKTLRVLSFAILFGMIFMIILSNYLVREYPETFVFYILAVIIAIVCSIPIANFYESMLTTGIGPYMISMKEANLFYLRLPFFIALIGIIGLIFLLFNTFKVSGDGGAG